jgi:sugar phosphate isomerase/epimerase
MERRDFLKTMGIGAIATAVGSNLLVSCTATASKALPSFGLITGSGGNWHADGIQAGLKQIAEWGYTDLEGGGARGMEIDELLSLWKSLGLRPVVGSANLGVLINEERLKPVIESAKAQGREYLACYWPWIGPAKHTVDGWKEVADNLNKGAAVCKREGITLIFHNHDMEFYPVEGQMPFDVLMAGLDPAVGIELDTYWAVKGGASPVEYLKKYPGRFPVLHLKDMPATVRCGEGLTVFDNLTDADFTAIGSGVLDFPSIFKLNAISGAKHFMVEADKPGDIPTFLEKSAKYLREVRF